MKQILANSDIAEIEISVPSGRRHLRACLRLAGGGEIVLQEATVAALVRGFISVKTHPVRESLRLTGKKMEPGEKKKDFADWQFVEDQ